MDLKKGYFLVAEDDIGHIKLYVDSHSKCAYVRYSLDHLGGLLQPLPVSGQK